MFSQIIDPVSISLHSYSQIKNKQTIDKSIQNKVDIIILFYYYFLLIFYD
jgi:hypothetical protein